MASVSLEGTTALVTGASSGIGREIAKILGARVKCLVLVARREERLRELRDTLVQVRRDLDVRIYVCDLGKRAELEALIGRLAEDGIHVDVLVNNAGIGDMGMFDMANAEKTRQLIELNVTSLTLLTLALLPRMVNQKRGGILNVSSGFGLAVLGGFAAYIGSKHYVTGFSEALRADLTGTGVGVTQVCPGPVATEFKDSVDNPTDLWVPGPMEISAEACARAAVRGFERGRAIVVPGIMMKAVLLLNGLSPRLFRRIVAGQAATTLRRVQQRALQKAPSN